MPRNMSFAMTTKQIRAQSKRVTRRQGWTNLEPGTLIQPVEKAMGLKKGEKVKKIGGLIRILSNQSQVIRDMQEPDLHLEGFPEMNIDEFIEMYCKANNVRPSDICNRIEFEYLPHE